MFCGNIPKNDFDANVPYFSDKTKSKIALLSVLTFVDCHYVRKTAIMSAALSDIATFVPIHAKNSESFLI